MDDIPDELTQALQDVDLEPRGPLDCARDVDRAVRDLLDHIDSRRLACPIDTELSSLLVDALVDIANVAYLLALSEDGDIDGN